MGRGNGNHTPSGAADLVQEKYEICRVHQLMLSSTNGSEKFGGLVSNKFKKLHVRVTVLERDDDFTRTGALSICYRLSRNQ